MVKTNNSNSDFVSKQTSLAFTKKVIPWPETESRFNVFLRHQQFFCIG